VDNAGNLVITGNVGGGKAFRGNVPYGSPTNFNGPLGSTSLDPFLRYSAVPPELSDGPAGYTPFYSATGTVATIQPGSSGVFAPGSPRIAATVLPLHSEQLPDMMPGSETPPPVVSTGRRIDGILGDSFSPSAGRVQTSSDGIVPLSFKTPEEMRRIIAGESSNPVAQRALAPQSIQTTTSEDYQRQVEQLQRDLDRVKTNASQFEQDLQAGKQASAAQVMEQKSTDAVPLSISAEALRRVMQPQSQPQNQPPTPNPPANQDLPPRLTTLSPDGSVTPGLMPGQTAAGSLGLMLASPPDSPTGAGMNAAPASGFGQSSSDMAALKNRINAVFASQAEGNPAEKAGDNSSNLRPQGPDPALTRGQALPAAASVPAMQRVEETVRAFDAPGKILEHPLQNSTGHAPAPAEPVPPPPDSLGAAPSTLSHGADAVTSGRPQVQGQTSLPPLPKEIKLDPVAKEKYDHYMNLAQAGMRQGRYSRAAEFFLLASGYNPRDARSQIGRSQALLASGEYPGSALCLTKAIELDSRAALAKSDLMETVGGPDRFLQRFTELKQRADTGDVPALQLLLAYVYQQMNRPEEARAALQAARKGMSSSKAADLLEAALRTPG
jgi:tetratricopeptide (TPR) repeat protein